MATVDLRLSLPNASPKVRKTVADILTDLAPIVTQRVVEARDKASARLVESLLEGVTMRGPDMKLARMQANAIRSIVEKSEWLTAHQIGELGGFSKTNFSAPANRWKNERKLFAIAYDGQDRFPRYALDENYRPLPAVEAVLRTLGMISSWRIAAWFESTNAWLDNRRPREVLGSAPEKVIDAANEYLSNAHG
jgi:hypothetical protein